jgi:hypothetical protein
MKDENLGLFYPYPLSFRHRCLRIDGIDNRNLFQAVGILAGEVGDPTIVGAHHR